MPASRILITRPRGQGDALAGALQAEGFSVVQQPLLEIVPAAGPSSAQRAQLLDLDHFQHIIFVSANAVRLGMSWIGDCWPQLPVGVNWYTVGAATARELAAHGVDVQEPGENMSSEGLLALPTLADVGGQRVLLVKGEGGRQALAEQLRARGARVGTLCCYRRGVPELPPGHLAELLAREDIEVIVLSSGEGLANLMTLLKPEENSRLQNIWLLLPSERVAAQARSAGHSRQIVADNASDEAVVRALRHWRQQAGESE